MLDLAFKMFMFMFMFFTQTEKHFFETLMSPFDLSDVFWLNTTGHFKADSRVSNIIVTFSALILDLLQVFLPINLILRPHTDCT